MSNTCGQGLAHHSALPETIAELLSAVAENLEAHLTAIDARDERSRPEYDAYVELANEHRAIEARLRALAETMAGYIDLPMANHDSGAMSSQRVRRALEHFVIKERALAELLRAWIEQHEVMLRQTPSRLPASR